MAQMVNNETIGNRSFKQKVRYSMCTDVRPSSRKVNVSVSGAQLVLPRPAFFWPANVGPLAPNGDGLIGNQMVLTHSIHPNGNR